MPRTWYVNDEGFDTELTSTNMEYCRGSWCTTSVCHPWFSPCSASQALYFVVMLVVHVIVATYDSGVGLWQLLVALKVRHQDRITILRGNHESRQVKPLELEAPYL